MSNFLYMYQNSVYNYLKRVHVMWLLVPFFAIGTKIPCGLIVVTFLKGKATLIITIFYMKDLNKP